jgi:ribA/ribD-fused uncharacterized protein
MISRFKDRYGFLSNFAFCNIEYDNVNYRSVEHAYQAAKTLDENERAKIRNEPSPGKAKRMGAELNLKGLQREDWQEINLSLMEHFLKQKFSYSFFKVQLLDTGDEELIEGNYWHDNFYGSCHCEDCEDKEKLNHLGKLLMKIREEIRK